MPAKKKVTKMSLNDFLADDNKGSTSWADDVGELPSAPASKISSGVDNEDNTSYGRSSNNSYRSDSYSRDRSDNYSRDRSDNFSRDRSDNYSRDRESRRPYEERAPAELPTEAPFKARVSNLPFDATESDLHDLFHELKIVHIHLVTDRETEKFKGNAFVEFDSLQALKDALELNGQSVQGRDARIAIANPPNQYGRGASSHQPDRTDTDSWRRSGPLPSADTNRNEDQRRFGGRDGGFGGRDGGRDGGFGGRDGGFGGGGRFGSRGGFEGRNEPVQRTRLNLQPRSVATTDSSAAKPTSSKPDPFGGAKPVDTDKALSELEKKHAEPSA